ncbi:MAG: glycosyltransferase family 4 protein [Clostridiales bacterium]|uniref:glycosyltransferase family 4 protein n=1 Tax=Caproiciproducens sp. MSJ-32 TaxID=2841527 RepID=UPI00181C9BF2|nr:glycosyltransferase family 4 protein [Caproiciproducens sp. MSJ-32]MBU5454986.1 glycosyltransferase family 4 protein [Caproiciproducens sp. MSJ-32]NLZ35846.1 glycosyltransferase family 4 protein [Clostridiales bacterium]
MKKKICHISTVHNENDNRIFYKQCRSISKAGYDVSLIVSSDRKKTVDGVNIIPLAKRSGRIGRIIYSRIEAYKKALEINADIYHFHDPELIPIGSKLAKKGKKVIYDVHEDVPKQILSKSYLGPNWFRKMISVIFNKYEKSKCKGFSAVVTILDELIDDFKKSNKNVISVKNYAIRDMIDKSNPLENKDNRDDFILIYIGAITKIRGIKEMIRVTEAFNGKVKLWLIGSWESEELRKECESLDGYKNTKYFGQMEAKDLYKYVKAADVGMSILHPTPNYKQSIPTKVIEYMACEIPIILSDFQYWGRLFGDVGIYVNPLDINVISKAIEYFINNKEKAKLIGHKNREIFMNNFCWDTEEKKLIDLYEKILAN